jgi:hypothetical protein
MKKILAVLAIVFILTGGTVFANDLAVSKSESGSVAVTGGVSVTTISPSIPMQPQPIYPYLLQMIPGVIADVTKDMPRYDIIDAYDKTKDLVVKSITYNGNIFDRIRLEDVKQEVLDRLPSAMKKLGAKTYDQVRFDVTLKMSSRTIGAGSGGGGTVSGFGGGINPLAYGSNASIMPAIAVNTADPQFQITYYLIKLEKKETRLLWEK